MDPRPPPPLDDERWQAWIDGRLDAEGARMIDEALARDAAARHEAEALRTQRQALGALHRALLDAPVPPALAAAATRLQRRRDDARAAWRWSGLAASLALAFGTGWLGHARWGTPDEAADLRQFARAAAAAHVVYQPEQRHPVEVPAAQQAHLVQWLSKRLGHALRVPDLRGSGYELVGGRLLPGEDGARAQFMYENAAGARVTLYVGAVEAGDKPTAFRFAAERGTSAFYWVDQGFGYALVGALAREPLLTLATEVHRQLAI